MGISETVLPMALVYSKRELECLWFMDKLTCGKGTTLILSIDGSQGIITLIIYILHVSFQKGFGMSWEFCWSIKRNIAHSFLIGKRIHICFDHECLLILSKRFPLSSRLNHPSAKTHTYVPIPWVPNLVHYLPILDKE